MDTQFITDNQGNKAATIVPFEKWEWMGEKKKFLSMFIWLALLLERFK